MDQEVVALVHLESQMVLHRLAHRARLEPEEVVAVREILPGPRHHLLVQPEEGLAATVHLAYA